MHILLHGNQANLTKSDSYLPLTNYPVRGFIIRRKKMKKEQIVEVVSRILDAKHPINVDGEVIDLSDYVSVYEDGRFSDDKEEWWFNPSSKQIITHYWSLWQGSDNVFRSRTLSDYMDLMPEDVTHFDRWVKGLKMMVVKEEE